MTTLQVEITGLDKLKTAFSKAPQLTTDEAGKAIQKSILTVHSAALREAPVNKQTGGGQLRQNIRTRFINRLSGAVQSLAPYSVFVHEGTRPHTIVPVVKKGLANTRTGEFFGKIVHHPGTTANPFMLRALTASRLAIASYFEQAINTVLLSFK